VILIVLVPKVSNNMVWGKKASLNEK